MKDDEYLLRALVKEQSDMTLAALCERVSKVTSKPPVTAAMCVELQFRFLTRLREASEKAEEYKSDV